MSSVKLGQTEGVLGKMSRYPIKDHTNVALVAPVHEITKFIWVTVTASWRVVTGNLVTPRTIERMLSHGHQFDMRKATVFDIGNQPIAKLSITEIPIIFFRHSRPRAEVHFVDADRLFVPLLRIAIFDPGGIVPGKAIEIEYERSRLQTMLAVKRERIAFQNDLTRAIAHFKFIVSPFADLRNEDFPNSGFRPLSHGINSSIPSVEIANYGNPLRIRSQNRKDYPVVTVYLGQVSTQFLVNLVVIPLAKKMHIQLAEKSSERIGIGDLEAVTSPTIDFQKVIKSRLGPFKFGFEETFFRNPFGGEQ